MYDRRVPPPEAMELFDRLLTGLAERGKYVFVIPGNHDSAVRLSHVNRLLETRKVYIAGSLTRELMHITVPGTPCPVTFWLMPYLFPKLVSRKEVLDRPDLTTYDAAARALLEAQPLDPSACNVLIAHQNVLASGTAPEHSGSETFIGGLGEIDFSAFDRFDYAALGHIHNAQKIGRETVRYAGCPLYYDFSEIGRRKGVTVVDVNGKGDIAVSLLELPLLHEVRQVTGTLEELLETGRALEDAQHWHIRAQLKDRVPGALEQLRAVYGRSLLQIQPADRIPGDRLPGADGAAGADGENAASSVADLFDAFYQYRTGELPDEEQEKLIRKILELQERSGDDLAAVTGAVPEEETEELLDVLGREEGAEPV